jgi:RNA polymerase sigma-70 factor (ECF subfamily)
MAVLEESRDVLERYSRGDLDAFEALFRQHQNKVFRWIMQVVRDRGAAEDLTVETFWRVYRAHARFDPKREFGAWVRRIAMNAALDYLKTMRRETGLAGDLAMPWAVDPGVSQEMRRKMEEAFRRLPAKLQITAALALIEERPYREISEALGISLGAVKLRVHRAVRLLRKDLRKQGIEP